MRYIMNKNINFEDNIFILNVRIRMIRDLLYLDADPGIFLEKTLDDLEFVNTVLDTLLGSLIENTRFLEREGEFDKLSDLEWQYNQLLTELYNGSGNISGSLFPETRGKILALRENSARRRKTIDESRGTEDQSAAEPVVSHDEMSELLRDF
jgi:hypothetical protein